jgi:hypothetical protein
MIYKKTLSMGAFLKKGIDFKEGEIIEIANEGKKIEGQFGTQDIFLVKLTNGKEGNVSINQTSVNSFIDAWGEDSINWIGKKVKTWKIKQNVAGKFLDVWYFSHPEAELTEVGFVLKDKEIKNNEIPVIEEEDIDVKDIPF